MFMNAKKVSESKVRKNIFRVVAEFFGSIKNELKQVSWTQKKELINCTKIILISAFTISLMIYLVDLFIQRGIKLVQFLTQWVFG